MSKKFVNALIVLITIYALYADLQIYGYICELAYCWVIVLVVHDIFLEYQHRKQVCNETLFKSVVYASKDMLLKAHNDMKSGNIYFPLCFFILISIILLFQKIRVCL